MKNTARTAMTALAVMSVLGGPGAALALNAGPPPTLPADIIEDGIVPCESHSPWLAAPDRKARYCITFASGGESVTGEPWAPPGWSPATPYICCYDGFGGI
ncbi:MAG: hypothetical protein HS101_19955 [Planctomycetia bacterium]|nr:hypothetical protein [Planctomycetia bacterium]